MVAPRFLLIGVGLASVLAADVADARPRRKRSRSSKPRLQEINMPPGFSWPPSAPMKLAGKACLAELDARQVRYRKGGPRRKVPTPVVLKSLTFGELKLVSTYRRGPFVMDCHLALELDRLAGALAIRGIREVHFSRIHDYTPVRTNGTETRALSRHALGLAIDVRALVDDAGRKAVVETDYPQGDALLLTFERAITESARFRTLLTPANDPLSHDDHFHLEAKVDYRETGKREEKRKRKKGTTR